VSMRRAWRRDGRVPDRLLAGAGALLLLLPFVTTFNDLLTVVALRLGVIGPFQVAAEGETHMVAVLLSTVGMRVGVTGANLVVVGPTGHAQDLFISWNCVGWQSLVLLGLSLPAGLRGSRLDVRLQVILLGLLGTVVVNLLRMTAVCVLATTAGRVAAIVFHDYGGTLLILAWLFAFWALAQRWLLADPNPEERAA
jgi:exosortase/archaeosortase family protein